MKCKLVEQGFKIGSCLTKKGKSFKRACEVTLEKKDNIWYRLIKSAHLSRPEHYFSIYQSGCNHSCLKCHSWEFTQIVNGNWLSTKQIGLLAEKYERKVTVQEPRERATMWHATDLCRSCGSCVIYGKRSLLCPGVLGSKQILLSPQGFGPARNIVAFTGGDLICFVDFYCQTTEEIKKKCKNMWVLIETNGYGLTPENLDKLKDSGVDSFWLDIKAYNKEIYRKLCGTTNEWILKTPSEILKRDFVLEVLTLFIPGWVEDDQILKISELLFELNPNIPLTILAFFPAYKMENIKSPNLSDMIRIYKKVKEIGLENVKLGNCGVFIKTAQDWDFLLKEIGIKGVG
ncbi:radical SAM protein [Candidatus Aminicenantes bacterium AH-873-B07]|jgi:pyruvate-formate lyase-activating enzyme|nr:radical SAM protein [Candidatus Aminicenantes bacterium AH-873-B07]